LHGKAFAGIRVVGPSNAPVLCVRLINWLLQCVFLEIVECSAFLWGQVLSFFDSKLVCQYIGLTLSQTH